MGLLPASHPGSWTIAGVKLPDFGLTELLGGNKTAQGGSNLLSPGVQTYGQTLTNNLTNGLVNIGAGGTTVPKPQVQGASTVGQQPATTGGAPSGGGGGSPSGGSGLNLNGPSAPPIDASNADAAMAAWQAERQGLLGQEPILDQTYNQGKTDIQDAIDSATNTADTQKLQNSTDYGNLLKNNLQTYQDTNRSRQGIFSNLGTLDSSAFQEQQFRGDQSFGQNKGTIEGDQLKQDTNITNTLTDFTNKAKSGLANLAIQYQSGKNALSTAISQGDIQGAQNVSNALADIRQKAADINNAITQFQNQASLYKSMGYNVNTTLPTYNAGAITPGVTNSFGQQLSAITNMTPKAATGPTGQGFIIDAQGNKRDPLTGQIVA